MFRIFLDRWLGASFVVIGISWAWTAHETLGDYLVGTSGAGPQIFPMALGLLLAVLGAVLAVTGKSGATTIRQGEIAGSRRELWVVSSTFGLLLAYAYLLEKTGFLIATPLAVTASLALVLGVTQWKLIGLMAIGLTTSVYLVFGLVLGTYLPRGTWIQLF